MFVTLCGVVARWGYYISDGVFFSSLKVAADIVPGEVLIEELVPASIGPYGESKIKAENFILNKLLSIKRLKPAKKGYILRPYMIHGPLNKRNLNILYSIVKKGIPWPLGAYKNKRSLCSIVNITYVVEQLIVRNKIDSSIYNICNDKPLLAN